MVSLTLTVWSNVIWSDEGLTILAEYYTCKAGRKEFMYMMEKLRIRIQ